MKYLVDVETDHGVADDDQCYRDTDAQNGDEDVVEAGRSDHQYHSPANVSVTHVFSRGRSNCASIIRVT